MIMPNRGHSTVHADQIVEIDACGLDTRDLNLKIKKVVAAGASRIKLDNVCGQRYIGTDIGDGVEIEINGTPGNSLGSFMNGPHITVFGNAQDGCGNTMNEGTIVVHGHAGDITGLSARGGKIFVRDGVGYRAGIHMKEYGDKKPCIVIGGSAQDFFGEYMAGGVMVLLGLNMKEGQRHRARFVGTGMHAGVIYVRGDVDRQRLGREVGISELDDSDRERLTGLVSEFADHFDMDEKKIMKNNFIKLSPLYLRPYGRLYAY
jgi:glutamate synthase domain-containing protein 3